MLSTLVGSFEAAASAGWTAFVTNTRLVAALSAVGTVAAAVAAWFSTQATARTIKEMRAARQQATQPHLVIAFPEELAKTVIAADRVVPAVQPGALTIRNDGLGLALEPWLSIRFQARQSFITRGPPGVAVANLRPARGRIDLEGHHGVEAFVRFTRAAWVLEGRGKLPVIRSAAGGMSVRVPDLRPGADLAMEVPEQVLNEMLLAILLAPYDEALVRATLAVVVEIRCKALSGLKVRRRQKVWIEASVEHIPGTVTITLTAPDRAFEPQWELAATNWDRRLIDLLSAAADEVLAMVSPVRWTTLRRLFGRLRRK